MLFSGPVVLQWIRAFTHIGVEQLTVKLERLFPVQPVGPSLLSYFPNLTALSAWNNKSNFVFPTATIKDDITRCCPLLIGLNLSDRLGTLVHNLWCHAIRNLFSIVFEFKPFSTQSIMTLLLHQATLINIHAFCPANGFAYDNVEFLQCPPISKKSSRFLQLFLKAVRDWKYCTYISTRWTWMKPRCEGGLLRI